MRRVFHKLLFLSFLLQAFMPVGFMPAFANDGATIVICSGVTGEAIEIQLNNDAPADNHNDKGASKCAYSAVGSYTCVSTPVLAKLDTSYILTAAALNDVFVKQSVFLSNHTRGPPHISLT